MIRHAISYESRTWLGWPSMQSASEMLRQHIAYACMWGKP